MIELPTHEFAREFGVSKIKVFRHGPRYVFVLMRILTAKKIRVIDHSYADVLQKKYRYVWHSTR